MIHLGQKSSIFILTGAGISSESGLSTFRDQNGLWNNYRIEEVATHEAFLKEPKRVHEFYNQRRKQLLSPEVGPNEAHIALARLHQQFRGQITLVTQNVDNLHERAGSQDVIHMHGELQKVRCLHCHAVMSWEKDLSVETPCPHCLKTNGLRPHIVWFGEMPFHMEEIHKAIEEADLFLSIGTSGLVYPAANFVRLCPDAIRIEINLEPSQNSRLFHQSINGLASIEVPKFVDHLIDQMI